MSERGRSRSPKSLTRSPRANGNENGASGSGGRLSPNDVDMKEDRAAPAPGSKGADDMDIDDEKDEGYKVVVVSGLTKNVHRGHLEEIFGEYGRITGLDLPLFKVCEL